MIKYKYLMAWDRMMHSSPAWMGKMQIEAEEDNAPLDVIFKDTDGKWHRFCEIVSQETKNRIKSIALGVL